MNVFKFGIDVGFMVINPCDMRPTVTEVKQWVDASLSRFMTGCLLKVCNKSAYLLIHQLRASDITRMKF